MKEIKLAQKLLPLALILFFLLPYILFFKLISFPETIQLPELAWALRNSAIQATIAAALCALVGYYLSFGIFQLPVKMQAIASKLCLLPFVLPSLFSILVMLSLVEPFPMGHVGVISIFIMMNLGFSVLQISTAIREKAGSMALVSEVYGIDAGKFRKKVLLPLIASDLKLNFIFIFLFCLSSLAVPLVAGGGKGTNLEVLIYEKIFIDQTWDVAWLLIAVQGGIIFLLSYFYLRPQTVSQKPFQPHAYYKSKAGLVGIAAYLSIFVSGYFLSLVHSFSYLDSLKEYQAEFLQVSFDSLLLLAVVLVTFFVILLLWIADYVTRLKHNSARHLISASTVLVGFSFYLIFPQTKQYDFVKMPLAYTILFFPGLFKMFFEKKLSQLHLQISVAKIYKISMTKIIFEIILKQMGWAVWLSTSLMMIWVLSDFAIAKALGTQMATLGLQTQNFLSSYRLESAYIVSFYILCIWALLSGGLYFLIKGYNGNNKKYRL